MREREHNPIMLQSKANTTSPDLDPEVESFCEQVARILVRVLKDLSPRTLLETCKFEKPKEILLLSIEEAAKIPGMADSHVFRVLRARQKEHPDNKILAVFRLSESRLVPPTS